MPVAIERGGVIAGIIVLIVAAAGAWSLFGAFPYLLCVLSASFLAPRVQLTCKAGHSLFASCKYNLTNAIYHN